MKTKVHIIAAARPNFMKAAPLYHALSADGAFDVKLIHTGQHYDDNMSGTFLRDLGLPDPDFNLAVGSGRHGAQTAAVIEKYESLCLDQDRPDWTIVIGDVNSTIACAMAAKKIGIPVAHLESGLRSFDRTMPEEINRIMTDAIADLLWTPSPDADEHLHNEGVSEDRIVRVGNIMIDSFEMQRPAIEASQTAKNLGVVEGKYGIVTLHRPSNVDQADSLRDILTGLVDVATDIELVWPLHPRTKARLEEFGLMDVLDSSAIRVIEPLSYIPFMSLVKDAGLVLTDSGGIQEETTYLGVPCLTLRPNTERPITITEGTNQLVKISNFVEKAKAVLNQQGQKKEPPALWDGQTAARIVTQFKDYIEKKKSEDGLHDCAA